jgi:hypothetical protein
LFKLLCIPSLVHNAYRIELKGESLRKHHASPPPKAVPTDE